MPTLLEKIEANARERLTLPAGRKPADELARYRNFLKVESHRLRIVHRGGGGGREVCRARTAMLDLLLRYAVVAESQAAPGAAPKKLAPIALVATGGYGRGELNPFSDIDIMLLHSGDAVTRDKVHPWVELLTGGFLWDLGLKVGPTVRSISDCIHVANTDMQSKTSLIEARLITGNSELFKIFQKQLVDKCVAGFEDEYIGLRVKDQAARHAKFGNSATMQEPNIKNGCGGLRDYQNLHWMAFFKYRTRTTAELAKRELISATEGKQLEAAYDFLLRARNELHYHAGRAVDVLSKSVQPMVANHLGFKDNSASKRLEAFMGEFYQHTRRLYLITRSVEQRLALLPKPKLLPDFGRLFRDRFGTSKDQVVDGFKFVEGEIQAVAEEAPEVREQLRFRQHGQPLLDRARDEINVARVFVELAHEFFEPLARRVVLEAELVRDHRLHAL